MRKWIAAAAFGAALAAGVLAAGGARAATMDETFGNTVVVTAGEDVVLRYRFEANHTFTVTLPDGSAGAGTWAVNGAQICLTMTGGQPECHPYHSDKKVGDAWSVQEADGSTTTVAIVRGR